MWSDVFLHDTNDEKIAIILMDTKGLFEPGTSQSENTQIFSLASLISSIQIFNLKNNIQESDLKCLDMATELSKLATQQVANHKNTKKLFQTLTFLIRDFNDDEVGYGYEGGEQLLNSTFEETNSHDDKTVDKYEENIHKSFETVKCFTMPHPGTLVIKKKFDGSWGELDSEFVDYVENIIEDLLSPEKLKKKTILGTEVTGESFNLFLKNSFKLFKNQNIPNDQSVLEVLIEFKMTSIVDQLLLDASKQFKEKIDPQTVQAGILQIFDAYPQIAKPNTTARFRELLSQDLRRFSDRQKTYVLVNSKNNRNETKVTEVNQIIKPGSILILEQNLSQKPLQPSNESIPEPDETFFASSYLKLSWELNLSARLSPYWITIKLSEKVAKLIISKKDLSTVEFKDFLKNMIGRMEHRNPTIGSLDHEDENNAVRYFMENMEEFMKFVEKNEGKDIYIQYSRNKPMNGELFLIE